MTMRLNDIFRLPEAALAGDKRIPKTMLVSQAALTKHEQKTLDKVKRVEHFATVQKSTTRIPSCVNDERDIQGIIFLRCEMAGDSEAYADVGKLLHKCFPNPTVIVFDGESHMCISASVTRKSLSEKGAVVVEDVQSTGRFAMGDCQYVAFLETLDFDKLDQRDLLCYVKDIAWNIQLSRSVPMLGFFPTCSEHDRGKLAELISESSRLSKELRDVQIAGKDKDASLNEKAKLCMRGKETKRKIDKIAEEIKEICDGGN